MVARYKDNSIDFIPIENLGVKFFEVDKRYRTLIKELRELDRPDILFIESNEKVLNALKLIKEQRLSKSYQKIILYMSEIYWDECNTNEPINDLLDDNVHIIFNFFSDESPFNLKTKSFTTIGAFSDITELYLEYYDFKKETPHYNLISKFGRPNGDKILYYEALKDYDKFIFSINNLGYGVSDIPGVSFESEKDATGDFKSYRLPKEDFISIASLDVETRCSTFGETPRLITCTEKTLKSFMYKRPSVNVMQYEAFDYFEKHGIIFPNYFGLNHRTQQMEICKKICELSQDEAIHWAHQYIDISNHNHKMLKLFLANQKKKLKSILNELYGG